MAACLQLAIVNQGGRVLLGEKKRGFGEGYFNGFGGKVEAGETVQQAAIREVSNRHHYRHAAQAKRAHLLGTRTHACVSMKPRNLRPYTCT